MPAFAQPTSLFQDPEQAVIQRKIAEAQALRDAGQSGKYGQGYQGGKVFIVGNPLLGGIQDIAGQYLGKKAEQEHSALMNQRNAEEDAFLAGRPSETMAQTSPIQGPTQPGEAPLGDVTTQIPKPYQQLAQETRDWTAKAPRYSPLGQTIRQLGMTQAINAPEKMFEKEEAAKLRAEAAAEAAKVRTADQQARLEAAKELQTQRDIAAKERAQEANALRLSIAGLAKSGQNANADLQREILEERLAALKAKNTAGPKLSAAEEKRKIGREDLAAKLANARSLLEANPEAVGLKTLIPNIALQRMSDSGGRMTRAALTEMAAEKAHALYGAAFTAAEQKRAGKFLPEDGDSYDTLIDKITNLENILAETGGASAGVTPSAAPAGQSPEDVQALIWATKTENQQDPRAIQIRNNLAGKK